MRHGSCSPQTHHAATAPHSAVSELEVVRRCYAHPVNDDLQSLWPDGELREVGRAIYESIPVPRRPVWAVAILDLCRSRHAPVPAVDSLCDIANDSRRWHEAHDAFTAVRLLGLACERGASCSPEYSALLRVAELVAKVTYNASGSSAPFDFHCGWSLPHAVRQFARALNDSEFDTAALKFLLHEAFPNDRNA